MEFKHLNPVPFQQVHIMGGLWQERINTVRSVTVPHCLKQCEDVKIILDKITSADGRPTLLSGKVGKADRGPAKFPCSVPAPGLLVPKLRLDWSLPGGMQTEPPSLPP